MTIISPDRPSTPTNREAAYKAGQVVRYGSDYYRCTNDVRSSTNPSGDPTNWELLSSSPDENPFDGAGYGPGSVAYFQDRIILGGSQIEPNAIRGSATAEYGMFIPGPNDADSWAFSFLSERSDKVQWIASREALIIGTTGGEWVITGGQNGITPSAVLAKRQTTFGSANVQGKLINENLVFVQKGGRKFREYYYQNDLQSYRAADLTFYSDHITEGGIVEFGFQADPDPILWAIRADGVLLGLTYDKANGIQGWHRHVTDGEIESFAVIPNGEEDQVWVVVKRTINGTETRYLEYFEARNQSSQRDRYHVDAGMTAEGAELTATAATAANPVAVTVASHGLSTNDFVRLTNVVGQTELEGRVFQITVTDPDTFTLNLEDGTGRSAATAADVEEVFNSISGLSHLEGETVAISVDGGPHAARTVSSGAVTLDAGTYGQTVHVGLPFTAQLTTMNMMAAITDARAGRIHRARIRFIETIQAKVGTTDDDLVEIIFREPTTPYGSPATLFTGEKQKVVPSLNSTDQRITIQSAEPAPCTVAVILPEAGVYPGGR